MASADINVDEHVDGSFHIDRIHWVAAVVLDANIPRHYHCRVYTTYMAMMKEAKKQIRSVVVESDHPGIFRSGGRCQSRLGTHRTTTPPQLTRTTTMLSSFFLQSKPSIDGNFKNSHNENE